ncbi:MAG: translocation/assembly module TamB domain-containing protein [Planctomycetota bacterium]
MLALTVVLLARNRIATSITRFALARAGIEVTELAGVDIGWQHARVARLAAHGVERSDWLAALEVEGVEIAYAPSQCLTGIGALRSVDVQRAAVELDFAPREPRPAGKPWLGLEHLPPISIARADIDARIGADFTIAAHDGRFTGGGDTIAIDARLTVAGGSGPGRVVLARRLLTAHGELDAVDLPVLAASIASMVPGASASSVPIEAGRADATVDFALAIGDGASLAVRARVATHDLRFAGRAFDALSGEIWFDADRIGARELFASVGSNAAHLQLLEIRRFAVDPCAPLALISAFGSADLVDVPALVPAAFLGAPSEPEVPPHRVTADFRASAGVLAIDRGLVETLDAHVTLERTRVPLYDDLTVALRDPLTRATLRFEIDDLAGIGAIAGPILGYGGGEPWTGQASGTVEFERGRGEVHARADRIGIGGFAIEECAVDAQIDERALTVSALHARANRAALDAHGKLWLDTGRFDGIELEALVPHIADWVPGLPLAAGATLRARAHGSEARIEELTIDGPQSSLTLAEPAVLVSGPAGIETRITLTGAGSVVADLGASRSGVRARATFERFEPQVLLEGLARFRIGTIDGTLEARWIDGALSGNVSVDVLELGLENSTDTCVLHVEASASESRLSLSELGLSCASGLRGRVEGELPLAADDALTAARPIALHGELDVPDLGALTTPPRLAGRMRASFDVRGDTDEPHIELGLSGEGLTWRRDEHAAEVGPFVFTGRADVAHDLCLRELVLALPNGAQATITGCLSDVPNPWSWLRGEERPSDESRWDVQAAVDGLDLAPLSTLVPGLRRIGGVARGSLALVGTLAQPEIQGELSLSNGELRTATAFPTIRGIDTRLTFDGDKVSIDEIRGELGGAPFELSGSVGLWGDDPEVALHLSGDNLLLYRDAGITLRGDAQLALEGPLGALTLRGRVALAEARLTREIELGSLANEELGGASAGFVPFSLREPMLAALRFDVRVTARTPFRIATSLISGAVRPDVALRGTGELPELYGTVDVLPTRVSLPSGTIWIRSGRLEFRPGAPFAPHLELAGDTRMLGYDIRIHVHGPYDAPVVELSSIPALAREDLMLLVLTGRPPGQPVSLATGERAATDLAVFFAQDVLRDVFGESGSDGDDVADRIEVYTNQDVTAKGADTWIGRFRLGRGVIADNDTLYLTSERDEYDHYNYGLRVVFRFP